MPHKSLLTIYWTGSADEFTLFAMGPLAFWRENLKRTFRDWESPQILAGFIAILVTAIGYGYFADDPKWARPAAIVGLVYFALLLLVVTPQRMWKESQQRIRQVEDRARPRLAFVFEPDTLPFLQVLTIEQNGEPVTHWVWRVGVKNDSDVVIRNVRVVLESFAVIHDEEITAAKPDQPALIEHALNVMGFDDKHGLVDVPPGDRPTAFFDVVGQWFTRENPHGDWMSPCYASGHRTLLLARGTYLLGLRVDGGGTYSRARFTVGATRDNREVRMRPYNQA